MFDIIFSFYLFVSKLRQDFGTVSAPANAQTSCALMLCSVSGEVPVLLFALVGFGFLDRP
jgi:hypothetical protein